MITGDDDHCMRVMVTEGEGDQRRSVRVISGGGDHW